MNTFKKNNSLLIGSIKEQPDFPHNPNNLVLVYDTSLEPANNTVSVPLNGTVNCTINWGDGSSQSYTTTGFKTHTYDSPGVYVVQISGVMTQLNPGVEISTSNNKLKLVRCLSFGNIGLTSLLNGFRNCANLIKCPASLPVNSDITTMSSLFFGCILFNDPNIANWNTSKVRTMVGVFDEASSFNQNIGSWNTSMVNNMSAMFRNAPSFNQPIGSWDTSEVTVMSSMFFGASSFNQNISSWNTSAVTTMSSMFRDASSFNQNIGSWNTANVTAMNSMFQNASAFNQNIGLWNTANVTNMSSMFRGASAFNQPIGSWNTAAVTDMSLMFLNASAFNQSIGSWNTAAVTSMLQMFNNASAFNQNIGGWITSAVTNMASMFRDASAFNQPIGGWDTSNVVTLVGMFQNAITFNQPIGSWNTGKVTTMLSMFQTSGGLGGSAFNQDIGNWNTSNVTNMSSMFFNATAFQQDISRWDIRKVASMATMFSSVSNIGNSNYNALLEAWADLADDDLRSQAITAFAAQGDNTRVTSNGHGMVAGSRVNISGTTNYNGDYNVIAATANTFDIAQEFVANDATGTMKHRRSRNITAGFGSNKYSTGAPATARGVLTTTYGWSITDGGLL